MRLLSTVGILLACIVVPIRQSMAGTRHTVIHGDPRDRMRGLPPEEDPNAPPLTDLELYEAKVILFNKVLGEKVDTKELKKALAGILRTVDKEEQDFIQLTLNFLKNALDRQPEVAPEDDDPNYPPAKERYAARNELKKTNVISDPKAYQEFERLARYTPAEKAKATKIKNAKVNRYKKISAALKKHESGEEILSDEVLEDYTKKMEKLMAELAEPSEKPKGSGGPGMGQMPPGMGQMPPGMGQMPPGMGQMPPGMGQMPPGMGQMPPGMGQMPPGMGQMPPGMGQMPPKSPEVHSTDEL